MSQRQNRKAIPCCSLQATDSGKKVPHKKNMGVRNRNEGKLKKSMLGAAAVKHIAMELNMNPPKKANGITSRNSGLEIKPNSQLTTPPEHDGCVDCCAGCSPQQLTCNHLFNTNGRGDDGVERFSGSTCAQTKRKCTRKRSRS